MHSISDVDNIDQQLLTEQISEAKKMRPYVWLIVFAAPLGIIVFMTFAIALGGW